MKLSLALPITVLAFSVLPLASRAQATPPAVSLGDLSQYRTADALWFHIQDLKKGPKIQPQSPAEYRAAIAKMELQICAAATEFMKRFSDDPRRWEARLLQIQMGSAMKGTASPSDSAAEVQQLLDLANRPDAPTAICGKARYALLGIALRSYKTGRSQITSASIVAQLKQFEIDFPAYPSLGIIKNQIAETLAPSDPAASTALLKGLAVSGGGQAGELARKEFETRDTLKSPLDLQFTAVDGSEVDLSRMRGKVVLVDFWATWCGPCKAEIPNVVAAYNKFHSRGFEVVGISLDQNKQSLQQYTGGHSMVWPQYFDGKGWQNRISSSFGIHSIPAMWLVNKQGYVVSTNGRSNLEAQVEKLLAE